MFGLHGVSDEPQVSHHDQGRRSLRGFEASPKLVRAGFDSTVRQAAAAVATFSDETGPPARSAHS